MNISDSKKDLKVEKKQEADKLIEELENIRSVPIESDHKTVPHKLSENPTVILAKK